jgi:hypothetical protein
MWYRKILDSLKGRAKKKLQSPLDRENTSDPPDNIPQEKNQADKLSRAEATGRDGATPSRDSPDTSSGLEKTDAEITPRPHRQQLVIGLDFGTAFTKVVIGETRAHFSVPFDPYHIDTNPYLLPSRFFIDSANVCTLGNNGGKEVTELKMRIIRNEYTQQDEAEITAYLALVLRHARNWLLSNHHSVYGQSQLDWLINIGLPTDSYHDEDLTELYKLFLKTAWSLSQGEQPITLDKAEDLIVEAYCAPRHGIASEISHDSFIGLFPEFVAQITGYVRSTRMQDDLHLLIDIGAGTADISVFMVNEVDGEHRFPILAREVKQLGTSYLMLHRLTETGHSKNKVVSYHQVPSREQFEKTIGGNGSEIKAIDEEFVRKLNRIVANLLDYTKDKRYPKSPRWKEGVPTFLCGGGARVDAYKDLGNHLERGKFNLRLSSVEIPEDLQSPLIEDSEYDRLSIAYGLSFDPLDIGDIIKQNKLEDVPPDDPPPEPEHLNWYR